MVVSVRVRALIAILLCGLLCGGWTHGLPTQNSEFNPNFFTAGSDYPTVSITKQSSSWTLLGSTGVANVPTPSDLDSNGYPTYGSATITSGGVYTVTYAPSQAEYPGNYVLTWTGSGQVFAVQTASTNSMVSFISIVALLARKIRSGTMPRDHPKSHFQNVHFSHGLGSGHGGAGGHGSGGTGAGVISCPS